MVYIREAHPTDGWQVSSNERDQVLIPSHRELEERRIVASACAATLGLTAPVLLDGMDNAADLAYGAWPERLYVIAADGRIAYQGAKGPYGFDPEELERFLAQRCGAAVPDGTLSATRPQIPERAAEESDG